MSPSNPIPKSKSRPSAFQNLPPPTAAFVAKKQRILDSLSVPDGTYTDKSPKGSIDAPIIELIDELNSLEGVVTTSSCSGRVAVFVEGTRPKLRVQEDPGLEDGGDGNGNRDVASDGEGENGVEDDGKEDIITGSPSGKGSGHWLFVSHDPITIPANPPTDFFTKLCGIIPLSSHPTSTVLPQSPTSTSASSTRLIKLSFSPLILHIHCSSLQHAKLLLTAAISAGFRESGVQSLKVLDDEDAGVALGIRTMGLGFESVIGQVRTIPGRPSIETGVTGNQDSSVDRDITGEKNGNADSNTNIDTTETTTTTAPTLTSSEEIYEPLVPEPYLTTMFHVINERFTWNLRRRERFRGEVRRLFGHAAGTEWEDGDVRKRRMREEGLRRKRELIPRQEMGDEEDRTGDGVGGENVDDDETRDIETSELVKSADVEISGMFEKDH